MEYKKCQNCGEKIHARTLKCPFCNSQVDENLEIFNDEEENIQEAKIDNQAIENTSERTNVGDPKIDLAIGKKEDIKDYVYKAEVRHSIEYTKPLPNALQVFLSAFATLPLMGRIVGGVC